MSQAWGEVVGEMGKRDLDGYTRQADGPDDQTQAALLGGEHVLELGTHSGGAKTNSSGRPRRLGRV